MQPRIRSGVIASACVSLGLLGASEGFAQQRYKVNCPQFRMMEMGTTAMFMSNEYTVDENNECVEGPFLSSWYGVLSDDDLPKVCPDCDPVAAPGLPIPEEPGAASARGAARDAVFTGSVFPGYPGEKKTSAFRPHEQPASNGGFPNTGNKKLKPQPLGTPPRFVSFEWNGETVFAIVLDYQIRPRKACPNPGNCNHLPKRQNIRFGYEIRHTNHESFHEVQIDPFWKPNPPQPKMVRILELDGKPCVVLLHDDQEAALLEPVPEPPSEQEATPSEEEAPSEQEATPSADT